MKPTDAMSPGPVFKGLLAALIFSSYGAFAAEPIPTQNNDSEGQFMDMSLEDLLDIQVEIVSKQATSISKTPAAVTVITGDDIRRSGARTLPDILSQAPGVQVARQNANYWAVSVRGFNDSFANKLLVMMDGRSLYTPLFSGTFWDVQDTLLEDIERIEIVRGPGSTVWGANAVNGVINIITKSAKDTQGTLVSAGGGTERHMDIGVRHGLKLADDLFLRLYGKYTDQDDLVLPTGSSANDAFYMGRGGFRLDWLPEDGTRVTLQGDLYSGKVHNDYVTFPNPPPPTVPATSGLSGVGGGNLLARLERDLPNDARLTVQAYYDRTVRQTSIFNETLDTGDLDVQGYVPIGNRHELTVGAGYRVTSDHQGMTSTLSFSPSERVTHLASAFLQDAIQLIPDRLSLTVGSKLEHNQFTGVEVQPGARLSFVPTTNHSAWLSVTRAVRTPSRSEDDVTIRRFLGFTLNIMGQRGFIAEEMLAYEAGYRWTPHPRVTLETALFYNDYDNLRTLEQTGTTITARNNMWGETYGVEFSPSFQLLDWWRLRMNYSFLQMQLHVPPGTPDTVSPMEEHQSPHHTLTFSSHMDLPRDVELDLQARYVDHIFIPRANNNAGVGIPAYWSLELRLGWQPRENLELSLVGQNLLDPSRPEFRETIVSVTSSEVQRSVYGMITYRF